jgi:hypothetical protein
MTENEQDRIKKLLQQALAPVEEERQQNLWPGMLRLMNEHSVVSAGPTGGWQWTWLDGALALGILALIAVCPSAIPVLLYNL